MVAVLQPVASGGDQGGKVWQARGSAAQAQPPAVQHGMAGAGQARGALLEGGLGLKRNKAYLPLRAAVCGRAIAPPLDDSMALLGRDRVLRRLRAAADGIPDEADADVR